MTHGDERFLGCQISKGLEDRIFFMWASSISFQKIEIKVRKRIINHEEVFVLACSDLVEL
jgi:hypothetical protein